LCFDTFNDHALYLSKELTSISMWLVCIQVVSVVKLLGFL